MQQTVDSAVTQRELADGRPAVTASAGRTLADLPVAGLTRRRIALLLGAVVAAWVVLLFAHQVGQASEATARVEAIQRENAVRQATVAALEGELALVGQRAYVAQQARQYRLGVADEIPFVLAPDAPTLPVDAPGSIGMKLGRPTDASSPLESWLRLLFGPGGDPSDAGRAGG
jgi:cell division protein FtsB